VVIKSVRTGAGGVFREGARYQLDRGTGTRSFGSIPRHVIRTHPWRHCFSTVDPWGWWRQTVSAHYLKAATVMLGIIWNLWN